MFNLLKEQIEGARARRRLRHLDDRLLADIGLTGQDVRSELSDRYTRIALQQRQFF
ncbi:DUF1127 domain-containing protein [Prosthecomicrobium pneumaticum]|uniref:Uncharacterized protein YjiS (DUF1127 family) n=1 Tax=Prosthecomicrobium pneumaticum TaxID=81895 RepID=A0A7W9FL72_9HYPH|nr:DUF1127 domain-containing protein [Prosthecomicrobium pneumaticum]MBB5752354.1 uncharacterized protein YjiS (DUF1127 family) [Prosthecomicrobium pneumaticum]